MGNRLYALVFGQGRSIGGVLLIDFIFIKSMIL